MSLKIINSLDEFPPKKERIHIARPMNMLPNSIFLAGIGAELSAWRSHVCNLLEQASFTGTVFMPFTKPSATAEQVEASLRWNQSAMRMSTVIMFWLPVEREDLGFDTVFQFGQHAQSAQLVVGIPKDAQYAEHVLNYYIKPYEWGAVHHTLEETTVAAMEKALERTSVFNSIPAYFQT